MLNGCSTVKSQARGVGGAISAGVLSNAGEAELFVASTTLTDNRALKDGGSVFAVGDGLIATISRSHFAGNAVEDFRGAMAVRKGSLVNKSASVFVRNTCAPASRNYGGDNTYGGFGGGAVAASKGTVYLTLSTMQENFASKGGGALLASEASKFLVADSYMHDNEVPSHEYGAALLVQEYSDVTLLRTTVGFHSQRQRFTGRGSRRFAQASSEQALRGIGILKVDRMSSLRLDDGSTIQWAPLESVGAQAWIHLEGSCRIVMCNFTGHPSDSVPLFHTFTTTVLRIFESRVQDLTLAAGKEPSSPPLIRNSHFMPPLHSGALRWSSLCSGGSGTRCVLEGLGCSAGCDSRAKCEVPASTGGVACSCAAAGLDFTGSRDLGTNCRKLTTADLFLKSRRLDLLIQKPGKIAGLSLYGHAYFPITI